MSLAVSGTSSIAQGGSSDLLEALRQSRRTEGGLGKRADQGDSTGQDQNQATASVGAALSGDADSAPALAPASGGASGSAKTQGEAKKSPAQQAELDKLKNRDREVRAHEQAHLAAAGGYVAGGANYSLQTGPDGHQYAVGGSVSLDASPVSGDPEATIQKAETIRRAALAPAEPSAQDRNVAAQALAMEAQARAEESLGQPQGAKSGHLAHSSAADSAKATGSTPAAGASDSAQVNATSASDHSSSGLSSPVGSRSAPSPDSHSPGGAVSFQEADRDPALSSLAAAALPGGPVPTQVPGSSSRDLAGPDNPAQAAAPATFASGLPQSLGREPVEGASQAQEAGSQEAKNFNQSLNSSPGQTAAKARAASGYSRAAQGQAQDRSSLSKVA